MVLFSGAIVLVSCSGGPSLNPPSGTIGGISASKSMLVLPREQAFKFLNIEFIFPAGEYRPAYEDTKGIYYEAPSQVIQRENFLGIVSNDRLTGGIYVERANPQVANIYSVAPKNKGGEIFRALYGGRPIIIARKPQPVEFTLRRL